MPTFISYDGAELHYDLLGDPALPRLIVQAGGAARHPSYLGDLAGLTSTRCLVVLHQRGVGDSLHAVGTAQNAGRWTELAEDIEALRQHLALERLELLGHSAGTRVALSYAARYPDRLARLCLVTPPATWLVEEPDDSRDIVARHSAEDWYPAFLDALPRYAAATTAQEAMDAFAAIAPISFAQWDDTAKLHQNIGQWYTEAQNAFMAGVEVDAAQLRQQLAQLQCETLVVAGDSDGLVGLRPVLALADLFPHGSVTVLDDCGHYPWVEQPAAFSAATASFFATA